MTGDGSRGKQVRAVLFAAIMVVSMVAMGASVFVGSAAGAATSVSATSADDITAGQTGVSQDVSFEVTIDGAASSETVTIDASGVLSDTTDVDISDTSDVSLAGDTDNVSVSRVTDNAGGDGADDGTIDVTLSDDTQDNTAHTVTVTTTLTHDTTGSNYAPADYSYAIKQDGGPSDMVSFSSTLTVSDGDNLQGAIDAASSGETITAETGNYDPVTITTSGVTLSGGNDANLPPTPSINASSTSSVAVDVEASGVTIDGFTLDGADGERVIDAEGVTGPTTVNSSVVNPDSTSPSDLFAIYADDTIYVRGTTVSEGSGSDAFGVRTKGDASESEFTGNTFEQLKVGIQTTDADNVTVSGNTFTNVSASGVYAVAKGSDQTESYTVTNNDFSDNGNGVDFGTNGATFTGELLVTNNDFDEADGLDGFGAVSVTDVNNDDSVPSVNATLNWWGSDNGPQDSTNTYNDGEQGDSVSDTVEFTPWLDNSTDNGGVEFAPVTNESDVGFASIQAAVDSTDDTANTIQVRNGTYSESIVIKTNDTTLQGVEDANGNLPTIVGEGVNEGSQPHAAIYVDGKGPTQETTVEGFNIHNPDGHYGVYAGTGGSNSDVDGFVLRNNTIKDIATNLNSHSPLAGSVSGLYVRAQYDNLTVEDNTVRNVNTEGDQYQNAVGLSFSSFIGNTAFADTDAGSETAENTTVQNNNVTNITGAESSRTKGISASGELDGMTISNNTITDISADTTDSTVLAISLTENPGGTGTDIDNDGTNERIGPRNFVINGNDIDDIAGQSGRLSTLFVGGYEDLGDNHFVEENNFQDTDTAVSRFYDSSQSGADSGDEDTLNATSNWWGSENGPQTSANTYNYGNQGTGVSDDVEFTPWLDNSTDNGGTEFAPVTNGSDDGFPSIQAAIDASSDETIDLAAGTFEEEVTVDSGVTLNGTGSSSDGTVLNGTGSGDGVTVDASDVSVEDIRITDYSNGIRLKGANSNITFENVYSVQNDVRGATVPGSADLQDLVLDGVSFSNNPNDGLRASTASSIDGLTIQNSQFDDNLGADSSGIEIYQNEETPGQLNDVVIEDTTFNNNGQKGIYTEKLSNATFDNVSVDGVQNDTNGFNTGIDINLKYDDYQNITIQNSVVANVSEGDPADPSDATGIAVKARDDGDGSYSSTPATLDDVTIDNVTVEDSFNGLRFGEFGVDYSGEPDGPTGVTVSDSTFEDNEGYHVEDVSNSVNLDTVESDNEFDRTATSSFGIYRSIQSAVDTASAGETIEVSSDTYNESVTVDQADITIESAGANGEPTINASDLGPAVDIQAQNVSLVGFTLETDSGDGVTVGDVDADAGDGIDIVGNNIVDVSGDGVSADDDGTGLVDAGENWWGSENGPNAENGSNATNVATAPFLTTPAGQLQSTGDGTPREFATELRLESGLNTLAFPAPSDRTLNETIDTDNVDTFYVYDNSEQTWLTPGDGTGTTFNTSMEPGALDVFVVVVEDGEQAAAVMEFENDFDGQANFDETDATVSTESWNLIGAANASNSSGTAFQGADVLVTTDDPYQDPNRQPFGVDSKNFSPYRGYWVYAEGESGGSDEVVSATFDGLTLQEYLESVNLDN
jgi:hypothetical protein